MIGTWGPMAFIVSEEEMRSFDGFNRREPARWAKHEVIGQKPRPEFLGPDQGKVSFKMRFDVSRGVNPRVELDKFVKIVRAGEAHQLIIGGKRIGVHKWYMPDTAQDWKYFDNKGNVLVSEITVNLEEYV